MSFTIGEISQSSRYRRWKEGRPLLRPLLSGERGRLRLPGYRVLRSIFAARSLCLLRCHHHGPPLADRSSMAAAWAPGGPVDKSGAPAVSR